MVELFNIPKFIRKKEILDFVKFAMKEIKLQKGNLNIVFLPNLKSLNRKFFGKNSDTNVIAFPWNERNVLDADIFLGEIYIGVRQLRKEKKRSLKERALYLILHGLLHIKGYGDKTEEENLKMFKIQERIFKKWKERRRV
ncbi:MAG: rRNA maturation RNase YbeY [Caldiserica bacterium]|nr:MAG: rRNA maturation RNase YbeY [Caldisericota bacterium]